MHIRSSRKAGKSWASALIVTAVLLGAGAGAAQQQLAGASAQDQSSVDSAQATQPAVWVSKKVNFHYRGFTTTYSCDGLREKVGKILLRLGARDVDVRGYGCTRLVGPDPLAGVAITMQVLQPAGSQREGEVPAQWQRVDVLRKRDPVIQAADCELVLEIKQQLLPLFSTRNVDYQATCQPRNLLIGATRLSADVLVPSQRVAGAALH